MTRDDGRRWQRVRGSVSILKKPPEECRRFCCFGIFIFSPLLSGGLEITSTWLTQTKHRETIRFVKWSLLNTSGIAARSHGESIPASHHLQKSFPRQPSDYIPQQEKWSRAFFIFSSKQRKPGELVLSLNDRRGENVMLQCCLHSVHAVESVWIMTNYIQKNNRFSLFPSVNSSPCPVSDIA